jgi:hypothetical protein
MTEQHRRRLRSTSVLRLSALGVAMITVIAVWLLPGTTTCPSPPSEIDPLECTHSALSPARDIVLVVGLLLVAALLIVAFVRDTE